MGWGRELGLRAARIALIVVAVAGLAYAFRGPLLAWFFRSDAPPSAQRGLGRDDLAAGRPAAVAEGLDVPWEIAFLPDGSLLVTERRGRLVRVAGDGARREYPVAGVAQVGEGGLMGLALHPEFESNRWLYMMFTAEGDGGLENRVVRYRFGDGGLSAPRVIVDGMPGARFHDGGRIAFGPDRLLYITTGDATGAARAQDTGSLGGKILRVTAEGDVPDGNPFGTPVYSYGHRNPQGLAWDSGGRLWATEHGRSGFESGLDELNRIEAGANYGWPRIEGDETAPGMRAPVFHSGPDYTWAPAGAAVWEDRLFFGGLRGEALYEARLADGAWDLRVHFHREFGRIRAVALGPDGMLYFGTSNRDGRGRVRRGDDKILRVDPEVFR